MKCEQNVIILRVNRRCVEACLGLYNESCGLCVDIPPVWCGGFAHVVQMLNTYGADGMHHMCEGPTLFLYMEG